MKLKLGIQRVDNIVFGRVLEQDEALRNTGEDYRVLADGGSVVTELASCGSPELSDWFLYVRGEITELDNDWFACAYVNEADAIQAVIDIKMLVAKVNGTSQEKIEDYALEIIE